MGQTLSNFNAKVEKSFQFGGIFKFYFNMDQSIIITRKSQVRLSKIKIKQQPDVKLCLDIPELN